jgi:hypothetical protein
MTRKERTTVTIETQQVTIITSRRQVRREWCPGCRMRVPMVTAEYAAAMLGATPRSIYRRVESGELHFTEREDGGLLICHPSLGGSA